MGRGNSPLKVCAVNGMRNSPLKVRPLGVAMLDNPSLSLAHSLHIPARIPDYSYFV